MGTVLTIVAIILIAGALGAIARAHHTGDAGAPYALLVYAIGMAAVIAISACGKNEPGFQAGAVSAFLALNLGFISRFTGSGRPTPVPNH